MLETVRNIKQTTAIWTYLENVRQSTAKNSDAMDDQINDDPQGDGLVT